MSKELLRASQFRVGKITKEIDEDLKPSEAVLKDLAELYEGALNQYKPGSIITGKIVSKGPSGVLVDIRYKSDGLIPLHEFNEVELKELKENSDLEVIIDKLEDIGGNVVLSYEKAKAAKAWEKIVKLFEKEEPVEGVITHKVKGGLSVDIGITAFLPGSQVDIQRVADFDQFVGQKVTALILKLNRKRGNVIISRRKYINEQRSEIRQQILESLEEGQTIQGTVKNITSYGVFIDIGGVDGLLHITDMTWGRIAHPSEVVNIGDTVSVKVLSFDKEHEKISLGMKQLTDNPWEKLDENIKVGSIIKGKISSITDYGLFVEIAPGVEGLVHISEISWTERITDLHRHFKSGQEVEVGVVARDRENKRMSLSVKQLTKNPWQEIDEKFEIGQQVTGKISNIADFGIFVQLLPGVDGLVHISDLSWTEHIKHPSDIFKRGDEVTAVVTDINKDKKKISLGIKQLSENPWNNIEQSYPVGSTVEGEVSKITDFGAFVKLEDGIEGLVHISELSTENVKKVGDILKVGDVKKFRVIKVSREEHKIGLSLKAEAAGREVSKEIKKPARKPTPKKHAAKPKKASTSIKSSLQLELEKHAARKKDTEK